MAEWNLRDTIARRNALVEAHLDMVSPIARGLAVKLPSAFDVEDLISAGYLGLIAAADHYDSAKYPDTPFTTYARYRIRGAMLDSVRRAPMSYAVGRCSLEEAPEVVMDAELETIIDQRRRSAAIAAAIPALDEKQQTVIRGHYHAGDGLKGVARALRVGKSRASQIHMSAVRALRVAVAGAA